MVFGTCEPPAKKRWLALTLEDAIFVPIALLVLVNLPFWILGTHAYILRPVFNLDLLAALIALAISAWAGATALVVFWVIDAVYSLAPSYHFGSAFEFFKAVQYLGNLDIETYLTSGIVGTVALFLACIACVVAIRKKLRVRVSAVIAWSLILLAIDVANGSGLPAVFNRDLSFLSVNVQGSAVLNLAASLVADRKSSKVSLEAWPKPRFDVVAWAGTHPNAGIAVILVESWGLHENAILRQWVVEPLVAQPLKQRWNVSVSETDFKGATTSGELRILCGLKGSYSRINEKNAASCMPSELRHLGFQTVAMHGFTGRMFDRANWWPMLGFDQRIFAENMPRDVLKCGGALSGVCDSSMLKGMGKEIGPGKFVYLLTLGTHLPLPIQPIPTALRHICIGQNVSESVCALTSQLRKLAEEIAVMIAKKNSSLLVLVSGDHSPPFLISADRMAFSQGKVPLVVMEPLERPLGLQQ